MRSAAPPQTAASSRKGNGKGDEVARSSHVRGSTRIHIDVCLTSTPSSARKVKRVLVDVRSSPDRGGDVCFVSAPPAAAKGEAEREAAADDELRRETAGLRNSTLRRSQPSARRLRPHLKAEARKRKATACSRSSANPPPAATKGKGRRQAAVEAEAEGQFFSGMSNEGLRRDIAEMSDGELRREITGLRNNTDLQFQPRLAERHRRILPLLEAEARRRQGSTRTQV